MLDRFKRWLDFRLGWVDVFPIMLGVGTLSYVLIYGHPAKLREAKRIEECEDLGGMLVDRNALPDEYTELELPSDRKR